MRHPIRLTALVIGLLASAAATSAPAIAQCSGSDIFEDNDDCASAVPITPGLYTGLECQGPLAVGGTDADFYRVTLPPGERLDVTIRFTHTPSRNLDLMLLDPLALPCFTPGSVLAFSASSTDDERLIRTNSSANSIDVLIAVVPSATDNVICNTYDLDVSVMPDACLQPAAFDDGFEENDQCSTAAVMVGSGAWTGLFVSPIDVDHYRINVPDGEIFSAAIAYDPQLAELGLELFADALCQSFMDSSSNGGHNAVAWLNDTGAAVDVTLRVVPQFGSGCSNYDLQLQVDPDPCVVSQNDSYAPNGTCATAAVILPGHQTGLFVDGPIADYFKVTVPGTDVLTVDLQYIEGINGDLGIRLYDSSNCSNLIDQSAWAAVDSVTTGASAGVTRDYYINVYPLGAPSDCNAYELNISLAPDPCVTASDDALEDNDSCSTAVTLTAGLYADLFASTGDADYYRVTLQPDERVIGEISFPFGSGAVLSLSSMDAACVTVLDAGGSHTEWANAGATAVDVTLIVATGDTSNGGCASYDLFLDVIVDPCLTTPDDGFEPNDDCTSAPQLNNGLYSNLFVHKNDADYFRVNLALGDQLGVGMQFNSPDVNIALRLYEAVPQAGGACGDGSFSIITGTGLFGSRQFSWTNDIGPGDYFIEVAISAWSSDDCTIYSLDVFDDGLPLAVPFCFGDGSAEAGQGGVSCPCGNLTSPGVQEGCFNSQGFGATLAATGSASIAQDNLRFDTAQARPMQPSMLVQGGSRIAVPFKDGVLCMGNPTERVEIIVLDAQGAGSTNSSIATEGQVAPGDRRYYQLWYRDPQISVCGSGSNFTHALQVDWVL